MTHDYKRNGTTTLFAAFDVLEGKVIGQLHAEAIGIRSSSANDVRCTSEQGIGNWQGKALRRLHVDRHVELTGLLDGQVAGVGPLEDTGDERGGTSVKEGAVWSVSQNSSSLGHMHVRRDNGNSIFK